MVQKKIVFILSDKPPKKESLVYLTFSVKTGQQSKKLWQTTGKGNTVCWLLEIEQTKQQYVPESSMALWSEEFIILSMMLNF